jgi:hypothetical protein
VTVRRLAAVVAVLVAVVAWAPVTAQASPCAGVTVVVDFGALGGTVRTGCAAGDPSSGTDALSAAGFGYTFALRQQGFVCRIDEQPAGDPCVTTSPPTAHWAYWHGQPGGSWTYSDTSAGAYDPAPGSVEGWSFGAGQQPGIAPPAPAPQPTQPAPQPPAPPAGQPTQPGRPAPPPGQPTQPSGTTAPTMTAETTTAPVSSEVTATTTSGSSAASVGSTSVAVTPTAGTSSGGTVGLVVGIVVVAALAGLGLWTARRRAKAAG